MRGGFATPASPPRAGRGDPARHRARLRSRPGREVQALQILAALLWQRRGCGHPAQLPRVTLLAVLASTRTASPCHLWPPARAPQSPGCTGAAGGWHGAAQGTRREGSLAGCSPPAHLRMVAAKPCTTPAPAQSSICSHLSRLINQTGGGIGLLPPRAAFPGSSARRDGDSRAMRVCWGRKRWQSSPKQSCPASPSSSGAPRTPGWFHPAAPITPSVALVPPELLYPRGAAGTAPTAPGPPEAG